MKTPVTATQKPTKAYVTIKLPKYMLIPLGYYLRAVPAADEAQGQALKAIELQINRVKSGDGSGKELTTEMTELQLTQWTVKLILECLVEFIPTEDPYASLMLDKLDEQLTAARQVPPPAVPESEAD